MTKKLINMATGGLMSMPPYIKSLDEKDEGITPYDVSTPESARKGLPQRSLSKSRTRYSRGDEAEIYAKIIGYQNANKTNGSQAPIPGQQPGMETPGGVPEQNAGTNLSGNGEIPIGADNAPMPGEMDFSGTIEEPA